MMVWHRGRGGYERSGQQGSPQTRGYRIIALVVASALFMQQLDGTVLTVALPTMARDLGSPATGSAPH